MIFFAVGFGSGYYYFYMTFVPPSPAVTEVKIGCIQPLSGPYASMGQGFRRGYELAADLWNKRGGIKSLGGAKVVLLYGDTVGEAETARVEAERLILKEKVSILCGTTVSAFSMVTTEVAERHHMPHVVDGSMTTKITARGFKYLVSVTMLNPDYTYFSIDWARNLFKCKRIAIIFENTEWGTDMATYAKERSEKHGMEVVLYEAYPSKITDMSPIILKLGKANPDVIFIAAYVSDAILFVNTMAEMGVCKNVPILGQGGGFATTDFLKGTGINCEGKFVTATWAPDVKSPGSKEFIEAHMTKWGSMADQWAALGYVSVLTACDAIERAGSTDPEKIMKALQATELTTILGVMKFDELGRRINPQPIELQYQKGNLVCVAPEEWAVAKPVLPPGYPKE